MAKFGIITAILGLLALFCGQVSGTWAAAGNACMKKNPNVIYAIAKFCQNGNIYVPGPWAQSGVKHGNGMLSAKITLGGQCFPATYVPQNVCQDQLTDMCVNGGPYGGGTRWHGWGNNKCQKWDIYIQR